MVASLRVAEALRQGAIERFVPVTDEDYDDIRAMWRRVQVSLQQKERGKRSIDGP